MESVVRILQTEPIAAFLPMLEILIIASFVAGVFVCEVSRMKDPTICPRCGEPWAEKQVAKEERRMDIAFDWSLVNKKKLGEHLEGAAICLAEGTPGFKFDDMLAPFVSEVFEELVKSNASPVMLLSAATAPASKIDDIMAMFKAAGVTKAVPAWLLNLLLPLAIEQIQKLIEKWFKK